MAGSKTWQAWSELLQAVLNAEAQVQGAYRVGGTRGAWVDGDSRSDVRGDVSRAARAIADADQEQDPERADHIFANVAVPLIQKAIQHGTANDFEDESQIMRELRRLEHRASAVDGWRDLRRSIRLGLDAATSEAGVPRVPPASVLVRTSPKVGRNQPCPCGSGKKYKRCCLS